jgi:signal peptidase I
MATTDPQPRPGTQAGEASGPPEAVRAKSQAREFIEAIGVALVLALVVRTVFIQAYKIPSRSMVPTLLVGDHILVNKFLYGTKIPFTDVRVLPIRPPARGDVIVFVPPDDPTKDFIKRIVAVPGDRLELRAKRVYVNGQPSDQEVHAVHDVGEEPSWDEAPPDSVRECRFPRSSTSAHRDWFGPCVVPPGRYFVMGDNRDQSHDSRFWGYVPMASIRGKAFVIYWSWDWDDGGPIWQRIRGSRIGDRVS